MKPFQRVEINEESLYPQIFQSTYRVDMSTALRMIDQIRSEQHFYNGTYRVSLSPPFPTNTTGWPDMTHMTITRVDETPVVSWDDLQEIKGELMGGNLEAIEIYPAESRLVNMGNQRHLWVFSPGFQVPMGWTTRMVASELHG